MPTELNTPLPLRRLLCASLTLAPFYAGFASAESRPMVEVWKSPTCGCCRVWMTHLEENGFTVQGHDSGNNVIRRRLGIPMALASCHTARVGGYAIEGHVPASDIIKLLDQQPDAVGLAVPQMPIGSPGMDGPAYGGRRDPYDVLLVKKDGSSSVFTSYR